MARRGSTSTANRLTRSGAVITGTPCTFAAWYKAITLPSTDANNGHAILVISDTATDDNFFGLFGRAADDLFRFSAQAGGLPLRNAVSTTAITVGQWFHVCGVSASTTDRRIYIDGVDEGQNIVSTIPAGLDQTQMFVTRISSGFFSPANADLADGGIWDVALAADEVAALAAGILPSEVRPLSLKMYPDLMLALSPEPDRTSNGNDLFVTGSLPRSDHAPVMSRRSSGIYVLGPTPVSSQVQFTSSIEVAQHGQEQIVASVAAEQNALVPIIVSIFVAQNGTVQVAASIAADIGGRVQVDASINASQNGEVEVVASIGVQLRIDGQVTADGSINALQNNQVQIVATVQAVSLGAVQEVVSIVVSQNAQVTVPVSISVLQAGGIVQIVASISVQENAQVFVNASIQAQVFIFIDGEVQVAASVEADHHLGLEDRSGAVQQAYIPNSGRFVLRNGTLFIVDNETLRAQQRPPEGFGWDLDLFTNPPGELIVKTDKPGSVPLQYKIDRDGGEFDMGVLRIEIPDDWPKS